MTREQIEAYRHGAANEVTKELCDLALAGLDAPTRLEALEAKIENALKSLDVCAIAGDKDSSCYYNAIDARALLQKDGG